MKSPTQLVAVAFGMLHGFEFLTENYRYRLLHETELVEYNSNHQVSKNFGEPSQSHLFNNNALTKDIVPIAVKLINFAFNCMDLFSYSLSFWGPVTLCVKKEK